MNNQFFKIKRVAGLSLAFSIIVAAVFLLRRHTETLTFSMVVEAFKGVPVRHIILSMLATCVSFVAMGANELIAIKALPRKKLFWHTPILAGTVGNALSNTLGFHAFTISVWRYRVYAPVGFSLLDITRVTGITFIAVVLGFSGVAGFSLLIDPGTYDRAKHIAGAFLLFFIAGFLLWIGRKPRRIGFQNWQIFLPGAQLGTLQCLVGMIDISAAIYAVYILIPADITLGFAHFSVLYIAAVLVGIASHVPGGIGIFEAGMMTALAANGRADVLAALLLYRVIYNLTPFGFACMAVAVHTLRKYPQLDNG